MRTKMAAVVAIALLPLLAAASELKPGTVQVTGASTLGFTTGDAKVTTKTPGAPDVTATTDVRTYGLETGALYYVTPMIGVGLDLGYGSKRSKLANETTTLTDAFVGPKVGVDLGVAERISVFADAAVGYAKAQEKFEDSLDPASNFDENGTGWGYRIAAGGKYFLLPALSLDLGLRYRASSVSFKRPNGEKVTTKTSDFGALLGISVYFGR